MLQLHRTSSLHSILPPLIFFLKIYYKEKFISNFQIALLINLLIPDLFKYERHINNVLLLGNHEISIIEITEWVDLERIGQTERMKATEKEDKAEEKIEM